MLARLGRDDEAIAAYTRAIQLTANQAEQSFLTARVRTISSGDNTG